MRALTLIPLLLWTNLVLAAPTPLEQALSKAGFEETRVTEAGDGVTVAFKIFHPSSMQVLPMQVTVKEKEKITYQEREEECWFFDLNMAGTKITIYVDDRGRVLKDLEQKGAMVIELVEGEE